jgi:PilZ domain
LASNGAQLRPKESPCADAKALRVWRRSDSFARTGSLSGGLLMDRDVERRSARRFSMMLPLRVRFTSEETIQEQEGQTRDVSFRGLYFTIEAALENGAPIEFVLTLPQQITLAGDVHIRCYARVLRVEPNDGRRGVAARIDRYEFLPASA